MSKIYTNITELIGGTPLLELKNYDASKNLNAKILAKLEYFNPAGSVKDRIAKSMIEDAEAKGLLKRRFSNNRTNKWKYWYWNSFSRNIKRI